MPSTSMTGTSAVLQILVFFLLDLFFPEIRELLAAIAIMFNFQFFSILLLSDPNIVLIVPPGVWKMLTGAVCWLH